MAQGFFYYKKYSIFHPTVYFLFFFLTVSCIKEVKAYMSKKNETYDNMVGTRIKDSTMEKLNKLTNDSGQSHSAVVRMILENVLDGNKINLSNKTDYQSMKELTREVNKIGVNINQIVRNANEKFYTIYEKKKLFAMMEKIQQMIAEQFNIDDEV